MIPFDFDYYKPTTIEHAVKTYLQLRAQGKRPIYLSGGTEIITFSRLNYYQPGAVIDIKAIPECNVFGFVHNQLMIGACVTLSELSVTPLFPLLSETVREIADQTSRNSITFGGNICSSLIYREAILPLLLTDSRLILAGPSGTREVRIHDVFVQQIHLSEGEFIVQTVTDRDYLSKPYVFYKKRKIGNVGYPLVTMAALMKANWIRTAYSGVCEFPFHSFEIDQALNGTKLSLSDRIEQAILRITAPILNDVGGSAKFREFIVKQTISDAVFTLKGG